MIEMVEKKEDTVLSETDFHALKRPKLLQAAKWIATFQGRTGPQLADEISADIKEVLPKKFTREAIPPAFRSGLFRQSQSLTEPQRAALIEKFFSHVARDGSTLATDQNWQDLFAQFFPGIDPHQFDQDSFSSLPAWPKVEFLLIRKIDAHRIRLSLMTIRENDDRTQMPRFLTLRKNDLGENKVVQGTALKSGSDIYTIGQLAGSPGLRFTHMKLGIEMSENGRRRANLYGLRLGLRSETHPFAHVLYGRQIREEVEDLRKQLVMNYGGIFDLTDPLIKRSLKALDIQSDALMKRLTPTIDETGLQPVMSDSEERTRPTADFSNAPKEPA